MPAWSASAVWLSALALSQVPVHKYSAFSLNSFTEYRPFYAWELMAKYLA
jgi:hypothetical protein